MKAIPAFLITLLMICSFVLYSYFKTRHEKLKEQNPKADSIEITSKARPMDSCKPGYSYMPSLQTSSLKIEADTCLPDSTCRNLWNEYGKNICGETSYVGMEMSFDGDCEGCLSSWHLNTWDSSLQSCIATDSWDVMRKGLWVPITKEQYDSLSKKRRENRQPQKKKRAKKRKPVQEPEVPIEEKYEYFDESVIKKA